MTTSYNNADLREILFGQGIPRATAVLPTVAQSPQNIFTVTGGRIVITSLIGEVTTAIGATPQTLKISSLASAAGASAVDLCAPSADISTAAIGTHLTLPQIVSDPMVTDIASLSGVLASPLRYIIPAGAITLTSTATNTGSVKWDIMYVPLDLGVIVAAA